MVGENRTTTKQQKQWRKESRKKEEKGKKEKKEKGKKILETLIQVTISKIFLP